jgi:predicted dehydrogenase
MDRKDLVRTIVIGAGPQGKRTIEVVRSMPNLRLTAVVDLRREALDQLELPGDVERCCSLEEGKGGNGIELVCIATNGPSHRMLTEQAVGLGAKYISIEKPMACSVGDCEAMIELCRKSNVRLAVNQSRRHDPMYRWLRSRIRSGEWGVIRTIWIQRPGIGLGCLATHSFDLATFLADSRVSEVSAWIDSPIGTNPRGEQFVDPGGLVIGILDSGARMIVAQIEDGSGPMSVEIDLTGARVRIDEKADQVEVIARDLSVIPGPNRPPIYNSVPIPEGLSARTNMGIMLTGVLQELVTGGTMECDAEYGKAAVDVLIAAYSSHRSGHRPVSIKTLEEGERKQPLPVT